MFSKGQIVKIVKLDWQDLMVGVQLGDLFVVEEDDEYAPYCKPLKGRLVGKVERWAIETQQLALATEEEKEEMFNIEDKDLERGMLVEVVFVDDDDMYCNIKVGDVFRVLENSNVPYCEPVSSDFTGDAYALTSTQLKILSETL